MRTSAREHEHESNKRLSIPITVRQVRLRAVIVTSRDVAMTARVIVMTSRVIVMTSRDVAMTSRVIVMTSRVFQSIYFRKNFHF